MRIEACTTLVNLSGEWDAIKRFQGFTTVTHLAKDDAKNDTH